MLSSRTKKIIFLILALFLIGLFICFILFLTNQALTPTNGQQTNNKYPEDKFKPNSQIKSPESNTWHHADFQVPTLDEDLESGIDNNGCKFKVLSYEQDGTEHSSGWLKRECRSKGTITVGHNKRCGYEGREACWVYITSQDKAGNTHTPNQEAKSIRYYNIDWTEPKVEKPFINENQKYPINIKENTEYTIKIKVSDNLKITGCSLYIDNENQGKMSPEVLGCGTQCTFSKKFTPQKTGLFNVFAVCKDAALNRGISETVIAKTNIGPEISFCGVSPTQGNIDTNFQFNLQASDPDNDELLAEWDFGDGQTSGEFNPVHGYKANGTYKPSVTVFDAGGMQDFCSTAWVIVE
jgi:hypothetical protein